MCSPHFFEERACIKDCKTKEAGYILVPSIKGVTAKISMSLSILNSVWESVFKEENDLNNLILGPSVGDSITKVWPEIERLSHIFAVTPFIFQNHLFHRYDATEKTCQVGLYKSDSFEDPLEPGTEKTMLMTMISSNGCVLRLYRVTANVDMGRKLCPRLGGHMVEIRSQKNVEDVLEAQGLCVWSYRIVGIYLVD